MTDFEVLNSRPAWCEAAIAEKTAKKLAKLEREEEVGIDEEQVALSASKSCAFNKALLRHGPRGAKAMAKYMVAQALPELTGAPDPQALEFPEVDCLGCKLCKQRILVVEDGSGKVRSFMTTPMIKAGSTYI